MKPKHAAFVIQSRLSITHIAVQSCAAPAPPSPAAATALIRSLPRLTKPFMFPKAPSTIINSNITMHPDPTFAIIFAIVELSANPL